MDRSSYMYFKVNQNEEDNLTGFYSFQNYEVSILNVPKRDETKYHIQYDQKTYSHLKDFFEYENKVKSLLENYVLQQKEFCTFNQLFHYSSKHICDQLELPSDILIPILFRVLNIEKIGPLLIDDQIDEIYLDSTKHPIYIDHSTYGRCLTSISLSKSEVESFVQRIALENDFSLNHANPTMKSDFVSSLFHTRVTVDIPPLIINDIHIDIRKFHSKRLKLSDLIKNGSITLMQVVFLIYSIQNQVSITILGPPNSGKTTLQNALIEYIPSHLRLLSVEDVLESTEIRKGNTIRFRLGYDPNESLLFSKSLEIQKILHRSPDYINLGELSVKDHFRAFLNVLSVGIPSIQTIHGKNAEFLFTRLKDIYNIPIELLKTSFPHVFVELDVTWTGNMKKRSVIRIAELNDKRNIVSVFDYELKSFFYQHNYETNIFTLKLLGERNQDEKIEITDIINELTGNLYNESIYRN